MKKTVIALTGAVLVAVLIGAVLLKSSQKPAYRTAKVERGQIVSSVSATGTLSAVVTVQVGSQVSGRIKDLYADFNSVVHEGQVIALLDPELFDAQVEQARANLSNARANVEKAKVAEAEAERGLRRSKELRSKSLISESEHDAAQSTYDSAMANVRSAEAQAEQADASLNWASVNLQHATIYAPVDGIVISRNVDVGQTVAASLQAPTLFTIANDLAQMQVHANISEADVGRIHVGQEVTFTVDAYPERRFKGALTQIRNAPTTVQNVVVYDGVIDVPNNDLALKPGMTATVSIVASKKDNVLKLPNTALRFKPPSAELEKMGRAANGMSPRSGEAQSAAGTLRRQTVWILAGGSLKQLPVRTGITDGIFSEILEGEVREGSEVVIDAPSAGPTGQPRGGFRFF